MRNNASLSSSVFRKLFREFLPGQILRGWFRSFGPARRRPAKVSSHDVVMALVFHMVAGAGTLAQHLKTLTGETISDSALSQRRESWPWQIFELILEHALRCKADPKKHPEAFYHGLRLCGADGSRFSVANTPQIKQKMRKAKSRRGRAAFAKVGVTVLLELGLRNPIAAAIGPREESEMVLSRQLLDKLPEKSLFLADRYYGVPVLLIELKKIHPKGREFLVRVKGQLQTRILESYADGSALVEIRAGQDKLLVREIVGQVRKGKASWSQVRLWTSLLD